MEENFSMEWNMEWKIFGMEWKWNGRKLPVWNMEKSSSIPFHTMPWFYLVCNHHFRSATGILEIPSQTSVSTIFWKCFCIVITLVF